MIKNYSEGSVFKDSPIENALKPTAYEQQRMEAIRWFQRNLIMPVTDERAGTVSRVHVSDSRVYTASVGSLCGLVVDDKAVPLTIQVMRELASALLICAERAECEDRMIESY